MTKAQEFIEQLYNLSIEFIEKQNQTDIKNFKITNYDNTDNVLSEFFEFVQNKKKN